MRKSIESAALTALRSAFAEVEMRCGTTRRGKRGSVQENAGLIAAVFQHETSRATPDEIPDPNLHWHMVVCNVSVREDGTTGAVDARDLFRPSMKMALGALFRAELSSELAALGLSSHRPVDDRGRKKSWFELDVIPQKLIDEFSKRRRQIEEWLKKKGITGSKAAERAALATRSAKEAIKRVNLIEEWQRVAKQLGFDSGKLGKLQGTEVEKSDIGKVLEDAIESITEHNARFTDVEFLMCVAQEAQCQGLGIQEISEAVNNTLSNNQELVRLEDRNGEPNFTTKEMLRLEALLLDAADRMSCDGHHRLNSPQVAACAENFPTLRDEQVAAVFHITDETARIACVNGMAGTGKTFMLKVANEAWEANGCSVIGTSLAASAAQNLETSSGIRSTHIHSLFRDIERGFVELDAKAVVVLDEAGMVGTRQLHKLFCIVDEAGAKIVMVGDYRQLQAINAGAPFRSIAEKIGYVQMKDITRQKKKWAQKAVHELAKGDAETALERFSKRGLLVIAEDRSQAMEELVSDWKQADAFQSSVIFAGTRLETLTLNRMCQAERLAAGKISGESIDVGANGFHVGDRVVTTRNKAALLVRNGNTGTVVGINSEKRVLRIEFDEGIQVELNVDAYSHLALAYASTTHRGQGQTVDNAFILAGGSMTDREISYVQGSRARLKTKIYSDVVTCGDVDYLAKQMSRSRSKDMAHDYVRTIQ